MDDCTTSAAISEDKRATDSAADIGAVSEPDVMETDD